jgi:DNA-binding response OmpR family regulator
MTENHQPEIIKLRHELAEAKEMLAYYADLFVGPKKYPSQFQLSPTETEILDCLIRTKGWCPTERINTAIGKNADYEGLSVYICYIRKKLAPFGIAINSHWGDGYFLDEANRNKIKSTIDANVPKLSRRQILKHETHPS